MKIGILGGGAVGSFAALAVRAALPAAQVTVIDAGGPRPRRTFVLLAGTRVRLAAAGLWEEIEPATHALDDLRATYRGQFGLLRLDGADCGAPALGHAVREDDLHDALRRAIAAAPGIEAIDGARVESCAPDGEVSFAAADGGHATRRFDAVAAAGLPEEVLLRAGFRFDAKEYGHRVLVTAFAAARPGHSAAERLLADAAVTLLPNRHGWCHILTMRAAAAAALEELADEDYEAHLRDASLLHPGPDAAIASRAAWQPRRRLAKPAGIGALALLGASACSVHPIGAQELNLGIRDALAWAKLLADGTEPASSGAACARLRQADRRRVAFATDALARAMLDLRLPGKLNLAGFAGTAVDLLPAARRAVLRRALALP
ncbi:MAG: FAD-dependent monooxygenase [Betaproteobacteria bacterium AqS2]|uniref:FAD-dependent monooxygenase n=1 Tax=Candidatus Amphirhobacter heronislandensis TaxID=1732024 RepID=A0A930Y0Q5_9GAMM|nr:FAD-dependent monooxygenase [Betaproteobacteria bacterium AqS2]